MRQEQGYTGSILSFSPLLVILGLPFHPNPGFLSIVCLLLGSDSPNPMDDIIQAFLAFGILLYLATDKNLQEICG